MANCTKCGHEFKDGETKNITKADLQEISLTPNGFAPGYTVQELLCDNCYGTGDYNGTQTQ